MALINLATGTTGILPVSRGGTGSQKGDAKSVGGIAPAQLTGLEYAANKGKPSGYASLDARGRVLDDQMPESFHRLKHTVTLLIATLIEHGIDLPPELHP